MRDFCADSLSAAFDILELSRQKPQIKKMCKKPHLTTTGNYERSLMQESYWEKIWKQYKKSKVGLLALGALLFFLLIAIYAPLLASSKPLWVEWQGTFYFPLFRYLFYRGFFTKSIDLFFNLLMLTLPLILLSYFFVKGKIGKTLIFSLIFCHFSLFFWLWNGAVKDPVQYQATENRRTLALVEKESLHEDPLLAPLPSPISWNFDKKYLNSYDALNQVLSHHHMLLQQKKLSPYLTTYSAKTGREMPTLWQVWQRNEENKKAELVRAIQEYETQYQETQMRFSGLREAYRPFSHAFIMAKSALKQSGREDEQIVAQKAFEDMLEKSQSLRTSLETARGILMHYKKIVAELHYLEDKNRWLEQESQKVKILIPPLIRHFHWEEDAGGAQEANQYLPWWELTRINRKDLVSSLIFGIRVSLVVGFIAITLALLIGIPLGICAGYFAGKTDLVICRFIEMWESMPTFFMLLLIVAITQSKSIFLVSAVLGIFGWTTLARYIRAEVLKERQLSYVMACHALGFSHLRIMFSHILPNAIPPILTLLPFSMMAAITSEAGLSFLGLGEEGSTSWGVLMDEGRSVFPAESYLLWPPALLLTLLLIAIALVGDRFRDAIDPKMHYS